MGAYEHQPQLDTISLGKPWVLMARGPLAKLMIACKDACTVLAKGGLWARMKWGLVP